MATADRIYTGRELAIDGAVLAGLVTVTYAAPPRLRPALGLATAIVLSRRHGHDRRRLERTLYRLFDERTSATNAVRAAHERIDDTRRRLDDAEVVLDVHAPPPDMARGPAVWALQRIRDRCEVRGRDGTAASS